jgi:hydrogenase maturation protease
MAGCSTRCVVADVLIIGYGNELRGDDGLGPFVARGIAAAGLPGVQVRTMVQLVPELAADLADARLAVFVDASMEPSESGVELRLLTVGDALDWSTHHGAPRQLLALTRAIYGRTPEAWWVTVAGADFTFRQGLSSHAEKGAWLALDRIRALLQGHRIDRREKP